MRTFYVYEHVRTDLMCVFYVGKGFGCRAHKMAQRNKHHAAIVSKLRREGFAVEVKIVESGLEERAALDLECERIKFWRDAGIELANYTNGGDGASGYVRSAETREKMRIRMLGSKINLGRHHSEETKKKISEKKRGISTISEKQREVLRKLALGNKYNLGKKASEETLQKMSDVHKKRNAKLKFENPEKWAEKCESMKGDKNPFFGKTHGPEVMAKIIAANLGKTHTAESKAKIAAASRGRAHTSESKAKLSAWHKGKTQSPEARAKISAAHMGKKLTAESIAKRSKTLSANTVRKHMVQSPERYRDC